MTVDELKDRVKNDGYKAKYTAPPQALRSDYVKDPKKSVNWNKAYLRQQSEKRQTIIKQNRDAENEMFRQFETDLANALQTDYKMTEKQANVTVRRAYESGHSAGYLEVITDAIELAEYWEEMADHD